MLTHTANPYTGTPQWVAAATRYLLPSYKNRLNSKQCLSGEGSFADCPDDPLPRSVNHPIRILAPDSPKDLCTLHCGCDIRIRSDETLKAQRRPSQLRSATRARPSRGTDLKLCGSNTLLVSRAVDLHIWVPVTRRPLRLLRGHIFRCTGGRFWVERHADGAESRERGLFQTARRAASQSQTPSRPSFLDSQAINWLPPPSRPRCQPPTRPLWTARKTRYRNHKQFLAGWTATRRRSGEVRSLTRGTGGAGWDATGQPVHSCV